MYVYMYVSVYVITIDWPLFSLLRLMIVHAT